MGFDSGAIDAGFVPFTPSERVNKNPAEIQPNFAQSNVILYIYILQGAAFFNKNLGGQAISSCKSRRAKELKRIDNIQFIIDPDEFVER